MSFDLVVVGGGSGGVRAARVAASLGAKVALVEGHRLGGTCVNVGCVPKKLLAYGAHYAHDLHDMAAYGWMVEGARFDWATLVANKDREIARLNGVYRNLLVHSGVTVIDGWARLVSPHEVAVGDQVLRAHTILVATGGRPWRPADLPGVEHTWTSDDLFALPALPARIVIVGAGYIACEFASILNALGVQVQIVMRSPLPLRGFDEELRAALCAALTARGVVFTVDDVLAVARDGELTVRMGKGSVTTDAVLLALSRVPNTAGLGLDACGVALAPDGAVIVDERFQSSVPSVFAIGDVVARFELTPVALAEAMAFAHQQFGSPRPALDYRLVPTAVFSSPELATVGLTEERARAEFAAVEVYASSFRPLRHTLTGTPLRSFVKVIVDRATDRVLGIHVLDDHAAEIVQGFAAALTAGITKTQLDRTLGIHPTSAEEVVTLRVPRS